MESLKKAWKPNEYCPLEPDDEFFQDGNNFCFNDNAHKYTCIVKDEDDDSYTNQSKNASRNIICEARNCKKTFDSLFLYELHYNMLHRDVCAQCNVRLPTSYLLDLHISERHADHTKFLCILPECLESFWTAEERKEHVIGKHHYPSNFRYFIYLGRKQAEKTRSNHQNDLKQGQDTSDTITSKQNINPNNNLTGTNQMKTVGDDDDIEDGKMDVSDNSPTSVLNRRVPAHICFGKGSHRGFVGRKPRR